MSEAEIFPNAEENKIKKELDELDEMEKQLKRDVELGPKANDNDYTVHKRRESDLENIGNQRRGLNERRQGDAMESFLEREYGENDKKEDTEQKQEIEKEKTEIEEEKPKEETVEEIEMSDLEDKELIKLSNEMKKAREDYNRNKEKTEGAWQRIKNVFPKLTLGENSASAQESQIYLKRYEESRNNLLKYQTEKLKKRNLLKEKRVKEVADLSKHYYNEDEQYDSLDKKTGEKFKFSDEEKIENKTGKKEKKESSAEKNRKKTLGEMFKKYKINEKDGFYDQSSGFIDKLMREVAVGHYENWKNSKDKKLADLVDEKGGPKDKISENIQKMEKYFENILGVKGKIEKNETVKQWLVRVIKESLEFNK